MMMLRFAVALVAACCAIGGCRAEPQAASATSTQALLPVTIQTQAGERRLRVEVARTSEEQSKGLMYRTSLPDDGGMLFPFDPPRPASFWMKNTVIPLDMIFIRADGTIARIAENTVPYSLTGVMSGEPVAAVLELAGGKSAALGIAEGDRVSWPGGPGQ